MSGLSEEIRNKRRGNVTASSAHQIMAKWNEPKPAQDYEKLIYQWMVDHGEKPLVGTIKDELTCVVNGEAIKAAWAAYQFDHAKAPAGLVTYANKLACEEMFEEDEMDNVSTRAMQIGAEREPQAVAEFAAATKLELRHIDSDQIHIAKDGMGATPDGIVYNGLELIETGIEVKCRKPLHHAEQSFIYNNDTLLEFDFERYCQIQVAMCVTDTHYWYSVNYNPNGRERLMRLHYAIIERDEKFITVLRERVQMVSELKEERIKKLSKISRPKPREFGVAA